jgi:hypothetical protein
MVGAPNRGLAAMFVMNAARAWAWAISPWGLTRVKSTRTLAYAKDRIR